MCSNCNGRVSCSAKTVLFSLSESVISRDEPIFEQRNERFSIIVIQFFLRKILKGNFQMKMKKSQTLKSECLEKKISDIEITMFGFIPVGTFPTVHTHEFIFLF